MRLLGIDFETTGLDTANDRIIEMGAVLWDVKTKKPLQTLNYFVYDETIPPLTEEITQVTGITQEMVQEFGISPVKVLHRLNEFCGSHQVDYLVAHNAEGFDKQVLMSEISRYRLECPHLQRLPWIDTLTDIPFPGEISTRKLSYLAADHGFINPFQHRALFDVLTMLNVLSRYELGAILEFQQIPWVTIQANVSYDDRMLAKEARFFWQAIGDKKYPNKWVKRIKKNVFEEEKASYRFPITVLSDDVK